VAVALTPPAPEGEKRQAGEVFEGSWRVGSPCGCGQFPSIVTSAAQRQGVRHRQTVRMSGRLPLPSPAAVWPGAGRGVEDPQGDGVPVAAHGRIAAGGAGRGKAGAGGGRWRTRWSGLQSMRQWA